MRVSPPASDHYRQKRDSRVPNTDGKNIRAREIQSFLL